MAQDQNLKILMQCEKEKQEFCGSDHVNQTISSDEAATASYKKQARALIQEDTLCSNIEDALDVLTG